MESHIGFKKCRNNRIVMLDIIGRNNELRLNIHDRDFAQMRCSKAKVISIYDAENTLLEYDVAYSIDNIDFEYRVGKVVIPKTFDENIDAVCSGGIHYFLTEKPAINWVDYPTDGLYESHHDDGKIHIICNYKNGHLDGHFEEIRKNGSIAMRCGFKNGMKDGLCEKFYPNNNILSRFSYDEGKMIGPIEEFDESGELSDRYVMKGGKRVSV